MFKELVITDIAMNKSILFFALLLNLFLFLLLGFREEDLGDFLGATTISFWVLLIIATSISGDEKRTRQLSQLPVTSSQIFLSGWLFVAAWISAQVVIWILFGLVFDPNFTLSQVPGLISVAFGIIIFSSLISIAIDLKAFRPGYLQWVYIATLVACFASIFQFNLSVGFVANTQGFNVFPFAFIESGPLELIVQLAVVTCLLTADYFVFTRSDNFLF